MRLLITTAFLTALPAMTIAQSAGETLRLDLGQPSVTTQAETAAPAQTAVAQPAATAATVGAQISTPSRMSENQIRLAQNIAQGNSDDKDHLIACSIVYQRVSDMYNERGDAAKSDSFVRTAYAYSQAADIIYTGQVGLEASYNIVVEKMQVISNSLNQQAQSLPNGDLGVIEQWLGWCDERGEFVQNTIDAFNAAAQ